jgi:hypothetical protein
MTSQVLYGKVIYKAAPENEFLTSLKNGASVIH